MNFPPPARRSGLGAWGAPAVLLTAYLVAMALLVASAFVDSRNARDLEQSGARVSQTITATEKLRQIGNTFFVAEASQRGYLLTGDDATLGPYREMRERIGTRVEEVASAVSDSPAQRESMAQLRETATRRFAEMQATLDAYRDGGQAAAREIIGRSENVRSMTAVRELIGKMLDEETRLLGERREAAAHSYTSGVNRGLFATGVVALALTAFYFLMHRSLRQRDEAMRVIEASKAALERRVVERTADLAHLSRHLLNVREQEKKGIARDLHDDFGSYLTAINMDVSRTRDKIAGTNPEQAAKLERTLGLLSSAIELKRQLISELRPSVLDNLGLGPALEQYIDEWSGRSNVASSFDYHGELVCDDEGGTIAIFRVFQEALANIGKHAKATKMAAYAYRTGDEIEFEIADNGVGIADADRLKTGVHGLLGIRERILAYDGRIDIVRGSQGGTVVRGAIPCFVAAADAAQARASASTPVPP
jgi:signal transduction histidine kinase